MYRTIIYISVAIFISFITYIIAHELTHVWQAHNMGLKVEGILLLSEECRICDNRNCINKTALACVNVSSPSDEITIKWNNAFQLHERQAGIVGIEVAFIVILLQMYYIYMRMRK